MELSAGKDYGRKTVRGIIIMFSAFVVISFFYALFTRSYNGDFIDRRASLNFLLLLINLILTLLPLVMLWVSYRFFKKKPVKRVVPIPLKPFEYFVLIILILNLVVTMAFGVGVATVEFYEAPPMIKPFIQVLNRIDFVYTSLLFILLSDNKAAIIRTTALIILISILKASIGIFLFIFMVLALKYYPQVKEYVRTRKKVLVLVLVLAPFFIQSLYEIRDQLRADDVHRQELSASKFFFGKLIGRLSSFSDSGIIIQEGLYFAVKAKSLDPYYYQKQAIGGVLGAAFLPALRPEFLMIRILDGKPNERVAFMCGTQGNLMISFLKSPRVFVFNLLTLALMVVLTFSLTRLLGFSYSNEFAAILLIYPLISGVANEMSMVVFTSFFFVLFFLFINAGIISRPVISPVNTQ